MPDQQPKRMNFRAVLEPDQTRLRWVIARVPFDVAKAWPVRRGRRVRGEIEGVPVRTSLFPDPRGEGQVLLVNKRLQKAIGATVGAQVKIWLEPDLEERTTETPRELAAALRGDRRLRKWFDSMSYSMRKEIGAWVVEPANPATRQVRAERMAERLLQAMEGETEPPPILRAAFAANPRAEEGWMLLTPTQRRNHLLGIFYYQTAEARERRAQKALEDALRAARKQSVKKSN